jgi:hypothetical protein
VSRMVMVVVRDTGVLSGGVNWSLMRFDNASNESFLHEQAVGTSLDVLLAAP